MPELSADQVREIRGWNDEEYAPTVVFDLCDTVEALRARLAAAEQRAEAAERERVEWQFVAIHSAMALWRTMRERDSLRGGLIERDRLAAENVRLRESIAAISSVLVSDSAKHGLAAVDVRVLLNSCKLALTAPETPKAAE